MRMKQAIVTGPTGAVGMALVRQLNMEGVQVAAVMRPASARRARLEELLAMPDFSCTETRLTIVDCGLDELEMLGDRLAAAGFAVGDDCVFYHLGWDGTFGNSRNNMYGQNLNVRYALDAVEAAKRLGCTAFVGTGSQAEYGRAEGRLTAATPTFPENGYGIAKLCAGQMTRLACQEAGIRHVWTRILSVYGPYDGMKTMVMSLIHSLLCHETPRCTAGGQMWDYLYSGDAGRALAAAGRSGRDGSIYVVGSGNARPLREYIEIIRDETAPGAAIGFGEVAYSPNQVMYLCADIDELTRDTGFVPQVDFKTGIRQTIEYVKHMEMGRL